MNEIINLCEKYTKPPSPITFNVLNQKTHFGILSGWETLPYKAERSFDVFDTSFVNDSFLELQKQEKKTGQVLAELRIADKTKKLLRPNRVGSSKSSVSVMKIKVPLSNFL